MERECNRLWGSACESRGLENQLDTLPPTIETLLLNAGLLCLLRWLNLSVNPPPRFAVTGPPIWPRTRAKPGTNSAGTSIEPFFATIKALFSLDPLPVQGKVKAFAFSLLALYAWNLIVLFNFLNNRPLGEVKPILDGL